MPSWISEIAQILLPKIPLNSPKFPKIPQKYLKCSLLPIVEISVWFLVELVQTSNYTISMYISKTSLMNETQNFNSHFFIIITECLMIINM